MNYSKKIDLLYAITAGSRSGLGNKIFSNLSKLHNNLSKMKFLGYFF